MRSAPSGAPYAAAICRIILAWFAVMSGISAPGMTATKPMTPFWNAVALMDSSATARLTNGKFAASARRLLLTRSPNHAPSARTMCSGSAMPMTSTGCPLPTSATP